MRNNYGVKNADQVRKVLDDSAKMLAVFQGHSHKNDLKAINGIHYCVHRAMVEGSGKREQRLLVMDAFDDGMIRVSGYHNQKTMSGNDEMSKRRQKHLADTVPLKLPVEHPGGERPAGRSECAREQIRNVL